LSAAKSFVEESAEREELEQLTDRQLLRRAAREVAIAVCWSLFTRERPLKFLR
jgi:hypothetical protein